MAKKAKHGGDDALADSILPTAQTLRHHACAMTKVLRRFFAVAILKASTLSHLVIKQSAVGEAEVESAAVCDGHGEPFHPKWSIHITGCTMHYSGDALV